MVFSPFDPTVASSYFVMSAHFLWKSFSLEWQTQLIAANQIQLTQTLISTVYAESVWAYHMSHSFQLGTLSPFLGRTFFDNLPLRDFVLFLCLHVEVLNEMRQCYQVTWALHVGEIKSLSLFPYPSVASSPLLNDETQTNDRPSKWRKMVEVCWPLTSVIRYACANWLAVFFINRHYGAMVLSPLAALLLLLPASSRAHVSTPAKVFSVMTQQNLAP